MAHPALLLLLVVGVSLSAVGCRMDSGNENPPPTPRSASERMTPPQAPTIAPLMPASPLGGRSKPSLQEETRKRYAVETCYYGSLGVPYSAEVYWESLAGADPSALNIPSFGEYPEHAPRRAGGKPPLAATMGRLPFEHYLRSCTSAKALEKGTWKDLDAALVIYEGYTSVVVRALSDSSRYYAREDFKRDDFRRGRELHEKLSDNLQRFDEEHARYAAAVKAWRASVEPGPDEAKRDEAGKLSREAVALARELTDRLLEPKPEREGVDKALDELRRKRAALARLKDSAKEDESPPAHARLVPRKLDEFIKAAQSVAGSVGKLDTKQRYSVASTFTGALDADKRALSLHIGGDDAFGGMGRMRPFDLRKRLRDPKRPGSRLKAPKHKPAPAKPAARKPAPSKPSKPSEP